MAISFIFNKSRNLVTLFILNHYQNVSLMELFFSLPTFIIFTMNLMHLYWDIWMKMCQKWTIIMINIITYGDDCWLLLVTLWELLSFLVVLIVTNDFICNFVNIITLYLNFCFLMIKLKDNLSNLIQDNNVSLSITNHYHDYDFKSISLMVTWWLI